MIQFIEELSANAWPSLYTYLYDGWLLRFSNGYSKRANSVMPLYSSSKELSEKVDFCCDFYKNLDLPTIFKITSADNQQPLDQLLCNKHFLRLDETSVMVNCIKSKPYQNNNHIEVKYELTPEWINSYIICAKIENLDVYKTLNTMLSKIVGQAIWVTYIHNNQAAGCGYGVLDRGYLGVFNIYVAKEYRGNGFGKAIMNQLFYESQKMNVYNTYLQVVCRNDVARNLYLKLGFKEVYKYWYRRSLF